MQRIDLRDASGSCSASILPEFGFNLFRLTVAGNEVLWSHADVEQGTTRPAGSGLPILFPFPGRLPGSTFTWNNRSYALQSDDGLGHAIHGFVLDRAWRVVDQQVSEVTGEFQPSLDAPELIGQWPSDFRIRCRYTLKSTDSEDLLAAIRTAYRVKLPKMEKERREAADYIREHYHDLKISPDILREFFGENEEHKRLYVEYVRSSTSRKQAMLNAAEGDPTSVVNVFPQLDASSSVSRKRLSARRSDTHLENLLLTWGNVDKTIGEHGLRKVPFMPPLN